MVDFLDDPPAPEAKPAARAKAKPKAEPKVEPVDNRRLYINDSGSILWTDEGKIFPQKTVRLTPEQAAGHPKRLRLVAT